MIMFLSQAELIDAKDLAGRLLEAPDLLRVERGGRLEVVERDPGA